MLKIEPIIGPVLPDNLRSRWNVLLGHSYPPTFQYDFDEVRSWVIHCRENWQPLVLLARNEQELVGILPLMYRDEKRRGILPFRRVRFLGLCRDFNLILARAGDAAQVVQAAFRWLTTGRFRWELMLLNDLAEGNPAAPALQSTLHELRIPFTQTAGKYYFVNLQRRWEELWSETSKDFVRRNINQARNRLAKAGAWDVLVNPDWTAERILNEACPIHVERQRELERDSLLGSPSGRSYVGELLTHAQAQKTLRTYWLRLQDRPIAYMIGFEQNKVYYFWNTGFHPDFSHLHPSRYLLFEALQDCHRRGLVEFNFMRGESEYKTKWTKSSRANCGFEISNNTVYSKTLLLTQRLARFAVAQIAV